MLESGFYLMDCLEGMKQFPDGFFNLAIVDPPYGGGFTDNGGCKGWFTKYHSNGKNIGGGYDSEDDLTATKKMTRTGGTWATKYGKKSLRGTLPRSRVILKNCSAFHSTRLSGGGQLLQPSAVEEFHHLAQADNQREFQHGDG